MEEAVSYWSRNSLENVGGKLLIAGFHTDEFITCEKQNHGVDLLGPLSDEALDDTLADFEARMHAAEHHLIVEAIERSLST